MMAVGAIEAITSRGLSCPGDISVVGYDNMPLAQHMTPPLTTIDIPAEELGRLAANMALRAIGEPDSPPELVQVPATLIVRGSTAPVRTKAGRARDTGKVRVSAK